MKNPNWPKTWTSIDEAPALLAKCRGLLGQVWEYHIGHSQMLVRYYEKSSLKGIYLYCTCVDKASFDAYWDDGDPKFTFERRDDRLFFEITDGDHLRIMCSAVCLAETETLIRIPRPFIDF